MRRIVLWFLGTLSAVAMLFGYHTSTSGTMAAATPSAVVPGSSTASTAKSAASAAGTTSSGSGGTGSGPGSSRSPQRQTVTGSVVSTQWGPVQVRVGLTHGSITRVTVLQYPDGNPRDAQINAYALPILVQETRQAQSANIQMVSGATYTSTGYLRSLQSALDQVQP